MSWMPTHKEQKYILTELGKEKRLELTIQVAPQVPRKINPQDKMGLSNPQKLVISVIEGEMSKTELMGRLELSDRKSYSAIYLNPSLEAGLVEKTIPDNLTNRNQKYRLTEMGKKYSKT